MEQWLLANLNVAQQLNPTLSDGVIITVMARVQGALIKFVEPENKARVINNVVGIIKSRADVVHQ